MSDDQAEVLRESLTVVLRLSNMIAPEERVSVSVCNSEACVDLS